MELRNLLQPDECGGMDDIRAEIDRIDRAVVGLIGRRYQYVLAAAKFKTSATSVKAPERLTAMLARRREWAVEEGLNADMIEKLYADLVAHFIDEEMQRWKADRE
ncbi:isochorismate lyase [Candidatus Macondimonas diazotrophica]|jgi:isochorismate pyruvate lyase|uniref:chorismate mutase n=1 Tax=Candidatus Macondimonas diazotrophica TaxID=2305248 RepID=A0A4Z0F7X2_9GAMM|nr:isochorismate lyase [Candidatus Macondimonas diazotrophica]NCU00185.1 isochorismate lyase [Candidatus Macondimonas diazotrophica]TFZ81838.1 isochorismate lyase [Candidatus Macondimonas diazotrophica]HBG30346.1 isochorismate-pyruvate lyase [Gammaproteobacteria bacterium]HBG50731.1 isochorismate-pyruvate lyase [Gammaproteobacteria bacterium]